MVGRREFLGALTAGLVGVPRVGRAQASGPPARVGWLGAGLREQGYVVGENLLVDVRTPDQDKVEQYPQLATLLARADRVIQ